MINDSPENLRREAEAGMALQARHTRMADPLIEQYMGSHFQEGRAPEIPAHEPHAQEFIVNTIGVLCSSNPRASCRSRRPLVHKALVPSLFHGCTRWMKDADFAGVHKRIAVDTMFGFGVSLMSMGPLPGFEDAATPPLVPKITRIPPKRFFLDPQATHPSEARFMGHVWVRDKEDLLAAVLPNGKRMFKAAEIRRLTGDAALERVGDLVDLNQLGIDRVDRDQIVGMELYIPERRKVYTLAMSAEEEFFIRDPRPYFGPPWGPYTLFGIYLVPDQLYPLSPLAVSAELVDELNAHVDQTKASADEYRQVTIVNGTNDRVVQIVKHGRHGQVYGAPGFDQSQVATLSIGGPDPKQLDYIDRLRLRLDRISGLTDIQRGSITGAATAFEIAKATGASDVRRKYMESEFRVGLNRNLQSAGWYMCHSSAAVFPIELPIEAVADVTENLPEPVLQAAGLLKMTPKVFLQTLGRMTGVTSVDATFYGGPQPGQEDFNFFDLELELEVLPGDMQDPQTKTQNMLTTYDITKDAAAQMPANPLIDWKGLLDAVYEALGVPNGSRFIRWDLAQTAGLGFDGPENNSTVGPQGVEPGTGAPPEPRAFLRPGGTAPMQPTGGSTRFGRQWKPRGPAGGGEGAGMMTAGAGSGDSP